MGKIRFEKYEIGAESSENDYSQGIANRSWRTPWISKENDEVAGWEKHG